MGAAWPISAEEIAEEFGLIGQRMHWRWCSLRLLEGVETELIR
jgi:hypothetical protein